MLSQLKQQPGRSLPGTRSARERGKAATTGGLHSATGEGGARGPSIIQPTKCKPTGGWGWRKKKGKKKKKKGKEGRKKKGNRGRGGRGESSSTIRRAWWLPRREGKRKHRPLANTAASQASDGTRHRTDSKRQKKVRTRRQWGGFRTERVWGRGEVRSCGAWLAGDSVKWLKGEETRWERKLLVSSTDRQRAAEWVFLKLHELQWSVSSIWSLPLDYALFEDQDYMASRGPLWLLRDSVTQCSGVPVVHSNLRSTTY